jgi:hypothetical protein
MSAQLVTAALRGAVTDPQGAAVPDAKVTITDTATGFTRTVTASLGPGNNNVDFGVDKNFKITERIKAQFRFEFFNLFNHPSYSAPHNQTIGFNDTVYGDSSGKVVPLTSATQILSATPAPGSNFGRTLSIRENGYRQLQYALKFTF